MTGTKGKEKRCRHSRSFVSLGRQVKKTNRIHRKPMHIERIDVSKVIIHRPFKSKSDLKMVQNAGKHLVCPLHILEWGNLDDEI